MNKNPVTPL